MTDRRKKLGPTATFPTGHLNEDDRGAVTYSVGHDPKTGKVIVHFGTPLAIWMGMDPDGAEALSRALHKHAILATVATNRRQ